MYKLYDILCLGEWASVCMKYGITDLPYQPEYLKLWEINGDGKATLFFYEDTCGIVLYPFLIRSLDTLAFISKEMSKDNYDITTPYGYGGPLVKAYDSSKTDLLVANFQLEFLDFCKGNNIVSEFVRFHPLLENHKYFLNYLNIETANYVVYVDLSLSEEQIWKNYEYNNQKNIKKAIRMGVEIIIDTNLDYMDEFIEVYYHTMQRENAKNYYFFSKEFFEFLYLYLRNNAIIFLSKIENKMVSVELALYDNTVIYSFLGGTLEEYFPFRPNNILKHELILWAKKRNIKYYLLGGGYLPNDGIFRYKRSFAKNGVKDFYIGKKIHDIGKYTRFEEAFNSNFIKLYPHINPAQIKYFPIYRFTP